MAAPVTMSSTLDNAGVQDPLIQNLRCNSVYYFAANKKLPPITICFHNFLVFVY